MIMKYKENMHAFNERIGNGNTTRQIKPARGEKYAEKGKRGNISNKLKTKSKICEGIF